MTTSSSARSRPVCSYMGWEVKSLRAGKAQITETYVMIQNGEALAAGRAYNPVKNRLNALQTRTHPRPQAAVTPQGTGQPDRPDRTQGHDAGCAKALLEKRPGQARNRRGQGQKAA